MNNTRYPIVALRNLIIFPGISVPIRVGRQQSLEALRFAREAGSQTKTPIKIITVLQKSDHIDHTAPVEAKDLYDIGVLCEVEHIKGQESEGLQILIRGIDRVKLSDFTMEDSPTGGVRYLSASTESLKENFTEEDHEKTKLVMTELKEAAKQLVEFLPSGAEYLTQIIDGIEDFEFLTFLGAANLDIPFAEKQSLLSEPKSEERARRLITIMSKIRSELQVKSEIRDKLNSKLGKTQRDAILREQMKAIREELGDSQSEIDRAEGYRAKIESANMPEEVKKVALEEAKRLESTPQQSPETHVIKNYLDLLLALPWEPTPLEDIDLNYAKTSLEADHDGLEKVKKLILEHLATLKLRGADRGMILLLVGPPGVGKTSLGASIAKALKRKFARAALGGVRDDAEIRGHRKTYVGAMPGRIIQAIKRAGTMNPVFMLDEIDKLSSGYNGDPSAALLEVLDPEQNNKFQDHYLDVPYDLSKVLFIATANSLESIPAPLRDRMEIIEINGYTANEKLRIAQHHLLPKLLKENGMDHDTTRVVISDDVIKKLISDYTREAGVRSLNRQMGSLLRSVAEKVIITKEPVRISPEDLDELLGPKKFDHEESLKQAPPGVVTGLAWTPVGGEILFLEATSMPGNGKLILTGQLGDVMKESAQIALSLIRSRLPQISEKIDFEKKDFHLHIPAGAIPKDGPSAGVAMVMALTSLLLGKPIDPKIAMTGEVTLRGQVSPIGGVKEKIIAAHRSGIKTVIIPRKNEKDLRDIPTELKEELKIEFADDIADVLRISLELNLPPLDTATGLWGGFTNLY